MTGKASSLSKSAMPHPLSEVGLRDFHQSLADWYRREKRDLPWRREPTPYHVAVSELMCQQTQIATVLPYYEKWMKLFPDWASLAKASEETVLKAWEGLGYYRRARMLHALAKTVAERRAKELPGDVEGLRELPGIGPYTAGAIASIAFGNKASLVDGNVERVLARLYDFHGDMAVPANRKIIQTLAEELLPEKNFGDYNQSLMELGALVCTPRKPTCMLCPVQKVCRAKNPESLPVKKRVDAVIEKETLAILRKKGELWLSLPEKPKRWKGFYRLPEFDEAQMILGQKLGTHSYTITKYRITAEVFLVSLKGSLKNGKWFSYSELDQIFLPAPHRKMIDEFAG